MSFWAILYRVCLAQRKTLYSRRGDADLCRVNTLAVLHASSRWARSGSRVNPQGTDITQNAYQNKIRGLFLITGEHGMKFQMELLRGTGTCKRLRSPEVPARICRTKPGWWIFPVSINAQSFLFAPLATNSSFDAKNTTKGVFFSPLFHHHLRQDQLHFLNCATASSGYTLWNRDKKK